MYLFFIYLCIFFIFFILWKKKKALESRGNFVVNFNWMWSKRKKGRKELSYFCTTKKNCKNNDCFQTDLPLSVIGLTTIIPPHTHVTA